MLRSQAKQRSANREPPGSVSLDRELVRRGGLYAFVKLAYPQVEAGDFIDGRHIEEICKHLEAVAYGKIKNLVINIPPGCMKSLLVSVFFPVWLWACVDPSRKWMFASFDAQLSLRDATKAKELLDSAWFRARWGNRVGLYKGNRAESASEYYTNARGMRFSTSVAGKATGWHSHVQVVDDPIKPKDTKGGSEATGVKLEECKQWWTSTMATRKADPACFARIVVMQRVHDLDLSGVCLESGEYEHLCLPMEFDPERACRTSVGGDWRTEPGGLLWPERFDQAAVEQLKEQLGPWDYEAQENQRPLPRSGGIFADAKFPTFRELPERRMQWLQSWDMRFKDSKTSGAYVVGTVWAYRGADFYLVAVYRGRWSFTETITRVRQATLDWPLATLKLVEDKANGPAVVDTLKSEIPGIVLVDPQGGKESRANAVAPYFESGNVYLREGAVWSLDVQSELLSFPRGKYDDIVDSISQALLRMHSNVGNLLRQAMKKLG